jgi:hypothetical protein
MVIGIPPPGGCVWIVFNLIHPPQAQRLLGQVADSDAAMAVFGAVVESIPTPRPQGSRLIARVRGQSSANVSCIAASRYIQPASSLRRFDTSIRGRQIAVRFV